MAILNFLNDESDVLACLDKRRGKFMLPSTCFACQENQRSLFEICNFRFNFFFFKFLFFNLLGQVSLINAELML